MKTQEHIETLLKKSLNPTYLEITDQSTEHEGHPQAILSGGGHYSVLVVSNQFQGLNLVMRHRLIYDLFKDSFKGEIHALSIKAFTPEEYKTISLKSGS